MVPQAMVEQECVGAIVCKLDMHKKMFRRGYIAMLAVDSKHRRKSIGKAAPPPPPKRSRIFSLEDSAITQCTGMDTESWFGNFPSEKCPLQPPHYILYIVCFSPLKYS